MKDKGNRDLIDRATRFALQIIELYSSLPQTTVAQMLGGQLLRSGTSVGAQYREANRAKSAADFISQIEGALQELDETSCWLELLTTSETARSSDMETAKRETEELISIVVAVVKMAKRGSSSFILPPSSLILSDVSP